MGSLKYTSAELILHLWIGKYGNWFTHFKNDICGKTLVVFVYVSNKKNSSTAADSQQRNCLYQCIGKLINCTTQQRCCCCCCFWYLLLVLFNNDVSPELLLLLLLLLAWENQLRILVMNHGIASMYSCASLFVHFVITNCSSCKLGHV